MSNDVIHPDLNEVSRRDFLRTSLGAAALIGFPTVIPASARGRNGAIAPSNRVNVALLACGSQSRAAGAYMHDEKSQIVAVCDPVLERRQERANEYGIPGHYNDFRDVLARSDVDAVHISTGDHWHVPLSLAAARAGKDVYCEKPLGISIEQDLAAREIVDTHHRVFQYGTQQRSSDACRMGIELVLNGHIGDVQEVFVWAPGGTSGGSATPVLPVPDGFDYDLWLGPAPEEPFNYDRCLNRPPGIWFIYDYAIGFVAGWGAHPVDQLQWWADQQNMGIPVEYKATGTIPTEGLFDTVTHWDMECTYANGIKMHFMDQQTALNSKDRVPIEQLSDVQGNCTLFMGSTGWVAVSRGLFQASSEAIRRKGKDPGPIRLTLSRNHPGNFIDSVLSRRQPISNIESAAKSDIICHMTDISIRTGETLGWDPVKETVLGSSDAVRMMNRPMRTPWTL